MQQLRLLDLLHTQHMESQTGEARWTRVSGCASTVASQTLCTVLSTELHQQSPNTACLQYLLFQFILVLVLQILIVVFSPLACHRVCSDRSTSCLAGCLLRSAGVKHRRTLLTKQWASVKTVPTGLRVEISDQSGLATSDATLYQLNDLGWRFASLTNLPNILTTTVQAVYYKNPLVARIPHFEGFVAQCRMVAGVR